MYANNKCIGHCLDPSKPDDLFSTLIQEIRSRFSTDGSHYEGFLFPGSGWRLSNLVSPLDHVEFRSVIFCGDFIINSIPSRGASPNIPLSLLGIEVRKNLRFSSYHNSHWTILESARVIGSIDFRESSFGPAKFHLRTSGAIEAHETNGKRIPFQGKVEFSGSEFSGCVDLRCCDFRGMVSFAGCKFQSKLDLNRIVFSSPVVFDDALFEEVDLRGTVFRADVSFQRSNIGEHSESVLLVDNLQASVKLEDCNFSRAIIHVNHPNELSSVSFAKVQWSRKRRLYELPLSPHFHQFNELNLEVQVRLMRIYRQRFEEDFRSREAGYFYIREMELQKGLERKWSLGWCINVLYGLVSRYGESILRPLAWIAAVLMLATLATFAGGVKMPSDPSRVLGNNLSLEPGTPFFADSEYWECFLINLNLLAPLRSRTEDHLNHMWQRTVVNVEAIAVLTLLSFLIVALRRRFRQRH